MGGRACALAFSLLLTGGEALAAPAISVEVAAPAATLPGESHVMQINYAVTGEDLIGFEIALALPEYVIPVDDVAPAELHRSCELEAGNSLLWHCSFGAETLEVPSGGLSGQVAVTLLFAPNALPPGEVLTVGATATANWDDGGTVTAAAPASAETTVTVGAAPVAVVAAGVLLRRVDIPNSEFGFAEVDGVAGALVSVSVTLANQDAGYIHPGAVATFELPAGSRYVRWQPGGNATPLAPTEKWDAGDLQLTVDTHLANPQPLVTTLADGVHYTGLAVQGAGGRYLIWIPCDSLPMTDPGAFAVTLVGSTEAGGTNVHTLAAATLTHSEQDLLQCDDVGELRTGGASEMGVGAAGGVQLIWFGPGTSTRYDAFVSVALPAGGPSVKQLGTPVGLWRQTEDHGFQHYGCVLPDVPGELSFAEFEAAQASACQPVEPNVEADFSETTHLVAYAPQWVIDEDGVDLATDPLYFNTHIVADDCSVDETTTYEYAGLASVRREPAGELETLTNSKQFTINAGAGLAIGHWGAGSGAPTASPGEQVDYILAIGAGGTPIRNQTYEVSLPQGVIPLSLATNNFGACEDLVEHEFTLEDDGSFTVQYWAGGDGDNVYATEACAAPVCGPAVFTAVILTLFYDPAWPWLDGETLTFAHVADAANSIHEGPLEATSTVVLQVPPAKRLTVEPVCDDGQTMGVRARASNSGGVALTNVVLEMPIPKAGDGSGTEVDTSLASVSADAAEGATIECLQGGSWVAEASCDGTATAARLMVPSVAAYTSVSLTSTLDVPNETPAGTVVRATAALSSSELLPIETQESAPAKVGLCPGTLEVSGWFDGNGNQQRDPGEATLAGWTVTVTDVALPDLVVSLVLPNDGKAAVNLAAGAYDITVTNPLAGGEAVWLFSTALPPTLDIVTDQTTELELGAFCVCNDNDHCTVDWCNMGECNHVFQSALGAGQTEVCDGMDNDCDGAVDPDCDDDGDGWCDADAECVPGPACPNGCGDCDDDPVTGGAVNPDSDELCDDVDNNCDEGTDEGCDDDGDDYCDAAIGCTDGLTPAICPNGCGDCDDEVPEVNGGAAELCNSIDDNCDSATDEGFGVGDACTAGTGECVSEGVLVCAEGGAAAACDAPPAEGAPETCDSLDNDCDGITDNATECDADLCTAGDACVEGACVAGPSQDCADGDDCTDDSCNAVTGDCVHSESTLCCTVAADCLAPTTACTVAACVDELCVEVPECLTLEVCIFGGCHNACDPIKEPTKCGESGDTLFECKTDPSNGKSGFVGQGCTDSDLCAFNGDVERFQCCTPDCDDRECGEPTECRLPCGECDEGWACAGPNEPLVVEGTDDDAFSCVPGCTQEAADVDDADWTWSVEVPECGPALAGAVALDTCPTCSGEEACYDGTCKTACDEAQIPEDGRCAGEVAQWCDTGSPKEADCLAEGSYCCTADATENPAEHAACCSCATECAAKDWQCGVNSCGELCGEPDTDDGCPQGHDCQARQCVCTIEEFCDEGDEPDTSTEPDTQPSEDVTTVGPGTDIEDEGPGHNSSSGCAAGDPSNNMPWTWALAWLTALAGWRRRRLLVPTR